jgi:cyanophycinase
MPGPLALVGGDEFHPGNETQDRLLIDAARGRPAYVLATAAREDPEAAVYTARSWFASLGIEIVELRVRTHADARSDARAAEAAGAGLIYVAGGDPGWLVQVLAASKVWAAIKQAWHDGAALAGSSAGAMAFCQWTLVRANWPGHTKRRPTAALGLVRGCALVPHYDTFGERWVPSALAGLPPGGRLLGVDERTAAMWMNGDWRVVGPGTATVIRGSIRVTFATHEHIEGLPQPSIVPA